MKEFVDFNKWERALMKDAEAHDGQKLVRNATCETPRTTIWERRRWHKFCHRLTGYIAPVNPSALRECRCNFLHIPNTNLRIETKVDAMDIHYIDVPQSRYGLLNPMTRNVTSWCPLFCINPRDVKGKRLQTICSRPVKLEGIEAILTNQRTLSLCSDTCSL